MAAIRPILVVENDVAVREVLLDQLADHGEFVGTPAASVEEAEALLSAPNARFDAILLDVGLPDGDGCDLCARLRQQGHQMPIIMLAGSDNELDVVRGLDAGANDYIVKPVTLTVLLARLRALLRREPVLLGTTLQVADLTLDTATRQVSRSGQPVTLTNKEYALLEYLMRHPSQVLTRTMIAEHVWNFDFDTGTNVIDVHIRYLRRKIDDPHDLKLIQTVRGAGYRISADPAT